MTAVVWWAVVVAFLAAMARTVFKVTAELADRVTAAYLRGRNKQAEENVQ